MSDIQEKLVDIVTWQQKTKNILVEIESAIKGRDAETMARVLARARDEIVVLRRSHARAMGNLHTKDEIEQELQVRRRQAQV